MGEKLEKEIAEQLLEERIKKISFLSLEELKKRFSYHKPKNEEVTNQHELIRHECLKLAEIIIRGVPTGREQALALTHLEEVMMWANVGIARNS